ncbi:hypothetical protein [Dietzia sp. 179-F 9C3 NHS]|uniref:hypothetical protein n=1 Tax=Dietzia sp. 179-F 9C3 NHS TaxID=3374295 RepID=UPI003879A0EC
MKSMLFRTPLEDFELNEYVPTGDLPLATERVVPRGHIPDGARVLARTTEIEQSEFMPARKAEDPVFTRTAIVLAHDLLTKGPFEAAIVTGVGPEHRQYEGTVTALHMSGMTPTLRIESRDLDGKRRRRDLDIDTIRAFAA